jgi:hypothetical protein
VVWVVLVVLEVSNIIVALLIAKRLHKIEKSLNTTLQSLKLTKDFNTTQIYNAIKSIPKEITVKNVLSLP